VNFQKGGDYVQEHVIYHSDSHSAHFCHSKYAGRRIPISGMDVSHIPGIDAVWYACRRNSRRLADGITETQAAKTEKRQKIIAAKSN
jgi:hypothetical protein